MKTYTMMRYTPIITPLLAAAALLLLFPSCANDLTEGAGTGTGTIALPAVVEELSAYKAVDVQPRAARAAGATTGHAASRRLFVGSSSVAGIGLPKGHVNAVTTAETTPASRGRVATTKWFYDDFSLSFYTYPASQSWGSYSNGQPSPAVSHEPLAVSKNWMSKEYWLGTAYRYAFFAYAPYDAEGVGTLTAAGAVGGPNFHYAVPSNATAESDLLVAHDADVPGDYNAIKTLKFTHALAAVRFAIGDKMARGRITKIRLTGVYGEADYDYATDSWQNLSTESDFELRQAFVIREDDKNYLLNNADNLFMMLPQTLPASAQIELTVDDGESHTFNIGIGGKKWERGTMTTYYISTAGTGSTYHLLISASSRPVDGAGATAPVKVISYIRSYYGTAKAVPWTGYFTLGNGSEQHTADAGFIKGFVSEGKGGADGNAMSLAFDQYVPVSTAASSSHTETLRAAADGSRDLQTGQESANCYVVSAPGTYTLPLVYGNSLKADGSANTAAFTAAGGTAVFVDHKGQTITSPYIYNKYVPADAVILWQDAPHLVSPPSVKVVDDSRKLQFTIKADSICQGNAVLAVRDADKNVLWSWHIWVTDEALDAAHAVTIDNNGGSLSYMPVPLGYCDSESRPYGIRTMTLHVTQEESGETAVRTLTQGGNDVVEYGATAPYFQWGRKDPFLPSMGTGNTNKGAYDNAYPLAAANENLSDVSASISRPWVMSSAMNGSTELWNAGNSDLTTTSETVTKTVYDPSPAGYCVPAAAMAVGWNGPSRSMWTSRLGVYGRYVYHHVTNVGGWTFFPAFGWRTSLAAPGEVGVQGDYWSAGPASGGAWYFYFFSDRINYQGIVRNYAFTIWPMKQ